uniref:Uncharacterized protein n=1 Tax=uncultured Desulfobacterium sp. TaxID=201089 RepID=E1YD23_9BACT|nr:unknown protein [uncultured Desulfobacterium sp.]
MRLLTSYHSPEDFFKNKTYKQVPPVPAPFHSQGQVPETAYCKTATLF